MKKILMIAYAFPPVSYAGAFRPLRFVKNLPKLGWQPLVVTLKESPDLENDSALLAQVPREAKIYRTSTIDPMRWLWRWEKSRVRTKASTGPVGEKGAAGEDLPRRPSVKRRIKDFLIRLVSFPDHMVFWIPFAIVRGAIIMLREKPAVIYSTSPPHSAHLSALVLSWLFRCPWVADFRDPWGDADFFSDQCFDSPWLKRVALFLERSIFRRASKVLMVTDCYRDMARKRFPDLDSSKFETLTNGFDLDTVKGLRPYPQEKFTIVYTGMFYAYRHPDLFLDGVRFWLDNYQHDNLAERFQVLFVGSTHQELRQKISSRGLDDFVRLEGFVTKEEALRYSLGAHLLLLIIGFNRGSEGILTSKIFDYFLCRKNILAIAPEGEAEKLIKRSRSGFVVSEDRPARVAEILEKQFSLYQDKQVAAYCPDEKVVATYESSKLTQQLCRYLDEVVTREEQRRAR